MVVKMTSLGMNMLRTTDVDMWDAMPLINLKMTDVDMKKLLGIVTTKNHVTKPVITWVQ